MAVVSTPGHMFVNTGLFARMVEPLQFTHDHNAAACQPVLWEKLTRSTF